MERELFEVIAHLRLLVCRRCRYAVRPAEVESHLKKQHGRECDDTNQIRQVTQRIQGWSSIEQNTAAIQVPRALNEPLPILPCRPNGLLCRRDPEHCQYLAYSMDSMRKHWRVVHRWARQTRRGRISNAERVKREAEVRRFCVNVHWQQAFPTREGSHYIHIRHPDSGPAGRGRQPDPTPPSSPGQASRAVDGVLQAWERVEAAQSAAAVLESDRMTDANPWLRMTGWARYLEGTHPEDLLRLIESPDAALAAGPALGLDEPAWKSLQSGIRVIWTAMAALTRRSQRTVQRCGGALRTEAARTELGQLPHRPLMAYMNQAAIVKHVRPWQQILAFVARTQIVTPANATEWRGKCPVYGMTARQHQKWRRLWSLALATADSSELGPESGSQSSQRVSRRLSTLSTSSSETERVETGAKTGVKLSEKSSSRDFDLAAAVQAWQMPPLECACLEFCVELLNQRHRSHEYEGPLMCGLAVLGWGESGWRDPESYPPILSRVIKVARFFLVQKALWLDPHVWDIIRGWERQNDCEWKRKRRSERASSSSSSQLVSWQLISADETLKDIVDLDFQPEIGDSAVNIMPVPSSALSRPRSSSSSIFGPVSSPVSRGGRPDRTPGSPTPTTPPPATFSAQPAFEPDVKESRHPFVVTGVSESEGRSLHDNVERMVRQFMVRGSRGPMQTMLAWRTYGLKVHYNSTGPGHITWMDPDRLLYKDVQFTMSEFRAFVHGLTAATGKLLAELLQVTQVAQSQTQTQTQTSSGFFGPDLDHDAQPSTSSPVEATCPDAPPQIPWRALYDDPTEATPGWSFLQDGRTVWPVTGSRWLMERLQAEPAFQKLLMRQDAMHRPSVDRYFANVVRFKEKLAVLVHVTAGQPARASELLSIQHVNTHTNQRRNIFVENELLAFVTAYHKGFHASNDTKIIHRYLPREVGALVIWYLWLVLPFVQRLEAWRSQSQASPLVEQSVEPSRLDSTPVSRVAGASTHSHGDEADQRADSAPPLTPVLNPRLWGPDPGTRRDWTSDRFRRVLKRETEIRLQQTLNIPAYRDVVVGISRRFMRSDSAFSQNIIQEEREQAGEAFQADGEEGVGADQTSSLSQAADLQAAHSSHVAGLVYGREITEPAGSTAHRRELFRLSSTDWHRFLGFDSATSSSFGPGLLGKRRRVPWEDEAEQQRSTRRRRLQTLDLTSAMRKMTGEATMQLREVQGPAIAAIQQGVSSVVAIMPTGGGKSMLFMLPAWAEPGGTTVVVVPLLALREDLMRRCRRLAIACVTWESRRPPDDATIVLVTPESVVTADFQSFLNRLQATRRLDRIVVDECHIVLNDQAGFRPSLARLGELVRAHTQLVWLTATLPPRTELEFARRIRHSREQIAIFRARTSRGNLAYRVWQPPPMKSGGPNSSLEGSSSSAQHSAVVAFVRRHVRRAQQSGGKVVVYAPTVSNVQSMARELRCEAYFSHQHDRSEMLDRFMRAVSEGGRSVIVATSALGMGVDIPNIRSVIHLEAPRTLLDYAQESGRAGRDGQISEAVIIVRGRPELDLEPGSEPGAELGSRPALASGKSVSTGFDPTPDIRPAPNEANVMREYLRGARCRRAVLDEYLDGSMNDHQRLRCGEAKLNSKEARCDVCDSNERLAQDLTAREMIDLNYDDDSNDVRTDAQTTTKSDDNNRVDETDETDDVDNETADSDSDSDDRESEESDEVTSNKSQRFSPARWSRRWAVVDVEARAQQAQQALNMEWAEQEAHRWQGRCYLCFVVGLKDDHELYSCHRSHSEVARAWMLQVRSRIRYRPFNQCFKCGMPQAICRGWERDQSCQYRGVLISMVAMMLHGPHRNQLRPLWEQWLQSKAVNSTDSDAVTRFLGQRAGEKQNQLFRAFVWLRQACKKWE